jgi:hypothetical protein
MLVRNEVERAVRLQDCGYQPLRWLEKALSDGFITPEAAGAYTTSEDAAHAWLDKHYFNLPENARPARSDLRAFGNLFSTYLGSTFDLDANPWKRLYSPDAHCFCPICSWMVQKPHLRPKTVRAGDKKIAERMKRKLHSSTRRRSSHSCFRPSPRRHLARPRASRSSWSLRVRRGFAGTLERQGGRCSFVGTLADLCLVTSGFPKKEVRLDC